MKTSIGKLDGVMQNLFETLPSLTGPAYTQCVVHNYELLLCGGYQNNECYSYHTLKKQYKRICSYPKTFILREHCVIKLASKNKNEIILLSFGGSINCTLMMRYVSVWNDEKKKEEIAIEDIKQINSNKWVPFTDNNNNPINIEEKQGDYAEARAIVGGSNNTLLFITYPPHGIDVFDLASFQRVYRDNLPTGWIRFHCFLSRTGNGLTITNKKHEMLLFCGNEGLSMEYDEDNKTFQFNKLPVAATIKPYHRYGCVYVDEFIFFFGGADYWNVLKTMHVFSMQEMQWIKFDNFFFSPVCNCIAVLNEYNATIHLIGGQDGNGNELSGHMKLNVKDLKGQCAGAYEIRREIQAMKKEMNKLGQELQIKKLKKVEFFFFATFMEERLIKIKK
ncbi:hypothetical protein RFI_11850 [Reticulomyxa filosa]|uniref:Kelch motif family protein n=1 Tax=Reticulomyxa filosa TaxID=46433 RepID=X6NG29_RETFI|nr:hypothetical protein RFI_11850 [Reticulomyxa filosa]|eukprot:ETO25285.1 hypothetical protein RFI_11850 [Reticulomyxa filosa]